MNVVSAIDRNELIRTARPHLELLLLLADRSPKFQADFMARGMSMHTAQTIIDSKQLLRELEEVARNGWAEDRGEHVASVSALAAPIRDAEGRVVAAVSITYFSEMHDAYRLAFLNLVQNCAASISTSLLRHEGAVLG